MYNTTAILLVLISATSLIQASQAESGAPTLAELENATFTGMEEGPVTLLNGSWEGKPYVEGGASQPTASLVDNVYYTGDLNGDGNQEAVVIIWRSGGGTGEYSYVMVMARQNGEIKTIGSALIGDRVKLRSGKVVDGSIILDVLQAGENDAMCCSSMLATRSWSLQGKQLKEGEIEVTGKLSLAVLEGTEWVLTNMNREETTIQKAKVSLVFADGRIAGKSACNRYFASIEEGAVAGDIKIGQAGSTRMACPEELMKIERQYLDALSHVSSFSFRAGSLALGGQKEDGTAFSMLFSKK